MFPEPITAYINDYNNLVARYNTEGDGKEQILLEILSLQFPIDKNYHFFLQDAKAVKKGRKYFNIFMDDYKRPFYRCDFEGNLFYRTEIRVIFNLITGNISEKINMVIGVLRNKTETRRKN